MARSQRFIDEYLEKRTQRHERALDRLHELDALQNELLLLRYCPEGGLSHWQRTMRPAQLVERAGRFGERIMVEAARIAGRKELPEQAKRRAWQRISKAGLGLSNQVTRCYVGHLGGWHALMRGFAARFPRLREARAAVWGSEASALKLSLQEARRTRYFSISKIL